ncbi:MAG TPA: AAA family ATPase [Streptosporangiaceae bacterium]|nr:AAA family ATPase [Streptosporangiaceae bacterium]
MNRQQEVAALRERVRELAAGRGGSLLVEGEPGIGKSALLAVALADARDFGCEVCWASCDELSQRLPLQVMFDCLGVHQMSADPDRVAVADLLRGGFVEAGGVPGSRGDPVAAMTERLLALVDVLCAASPVLMVLDDLQWADDASLLLWYRFVRAVEQVPLLLVGALRPVPQREEVARLRRDMRARDTAVVSLGPLPPGEVAELVAGLVGAPAGPKLARWAESGSGNPLYIRELVDALLRDGAVSVEGGLAEIAQPDLAVSGSLPAAIEGRLGFLSQDARSVLRSAALLGREFSVTDLALTAGQSAGALMDGVLAEAVAARVVEGAGTRMRFRHELIRQALYEQVPKAVRQALHREIAMSLAMAGAPVERVAQQLLSVTEADAWMLGWLADHGRALVGRAPQIAAEVLSRAVEQAPAEDRLRNVLDSHLATAAFQVSHYDQAERSARRVLASTADSDRAGEMGWVLGYALIRTRQYDEALEAISLTCRERPLSEVWAIRLAVLRAVVLSTIGRADETEAAACQALADAERVGDALAIGYAQHVLSTACAQRHENDSLIERIEAGLSAVDGLPSAADLRLMMMKNRFAALARLDRLAEAETAIAEFRTAAQRLGVSTYRIAKFQASAADHMYQLGRWDDALAELESIVEAAADTLLSLRIHGIAAQIAAHRDQGEEAARHLLTVRDQPILVGEALESASQMWVARAMMAERSGDLELALAELRPLLEGSDSTGNLDRYRWLPTLVRLALAAGDRDLADAAADACAADLNGSVSVPERAAVQRCRGLVEADPRPLLAVAGYHRAVGRVPESAAALEDAAVVLAQQGHATRARAAAGEAFDIYGRLGAEWDIRRATSRLRPYGIHRGRTGRRRLRPASGWQALTATEVKVALLVGRGYSNPRIAEELFLARSTVQTHVSHILAKLGVHSRSGIAREAARCG